MEVLCETSDLLVFCHLRWNFVFQRPQHLMTRFAAFRRVYFFEEPIFGKTEIPGYHIRETPENIQVVTPYLPSDLNPEEQNLALTRLVNELVEEESFFNYTIWYYTPMALPFSRHLRPNAVLYDCMDELSKFKDAPTKISELEKELLKRADLVFTGGHSLFEVKKNYHHNIHPFPSSIDFPHFSAGRADHPEPADQAMIPHPRLGFFGVVDERMDLDLLDNMAQARPDWSFVIIGPVVKISEESLPRRANIYYLGKKEYSELPAYLAGWDCALMPFALNESTRFISPTKTPEYLAAGKPVVSTPIRDVVSPYGDQNLVFIAETAEQFVESAEHAMQELDKQIWLKQVDSFLNGMSWDNTWAQMAKLEWLLNGTRPVLKPRPSRHHSVFTRNGIHS